MRIAVLYNDVDRSSNDAADSDVLIQCDAVCEALSRLGHVGMPIACTLDLETVRVELTRTKPDIVFNLVESLGGSDRMMAAATLLLESISLPFTGSGTLAIVTSGDKLRTKEILSDNGIATPAVYDRQSNQWRDGAEQVTPPEKFIVKSIYEHASLALDDLCVNPWTSDTHAQSCLQSLEHRTGQPSMAEEYIEGREFNLSLIERNGVIQVLAPAEIEFQDYPDGKPHIVGYAAKWDEDSIEYRCTPRTFEFGESDRPLLEQLQSLAERCFRLLGLGGYARVDFRVPSQSHSDPQRRMPNVLEINANPCLSPDAGFAAALAQTQIPFEEAIQFLLDAALRAYRKTELCS